MVGSVTKLLGKMYAAEINAGISSFWDGGIRAFVGDETNGIKAEKTFSVGSGPRDLASWDDLWRSVAKWFADWVIRDAENDENRSGDPGCMECTAGTTPRDRVTGLCAYHYAKSLHARPGYFAQSQCSTPEQAPQNRSDASK